MNRSECLIMLDRRLEIFIKVVEKGSVTAVANELYISQPAVSKHIKSLEDELNVKLFHRDKRNGLILTDVGNDILLLAKQQAEIDNRIYQRAYQENNFIGGKLRIASLPILSTVLLSEILPLYREKYPHVSIEIIEGTPREVRQMVLNHTVDFALACSPFVDVDYDVLLHDHMVAACSPDVPHIPDEIDLLLGTDHLLFCRAGTETVLEELSGRFRIHFDHALMFDEVYTVIKMVEKGNGIGIINKFSLDAISNNLIRLPLKPAINIDIGIEAIDLKDLTPVANEFYSMLRHSYQTHE